MTKLYKTVPAWEGNSDTVSSTLAHGEVVPDQLEEEDKLKNISSEGKHKIAAVRGNLEKSGNLLL